MGLLDYNKAIFETYMLRHGGGMASLLEMSDADLRALSSQITPQSSRACLARRFRRLVGNDHADHMLILETKRLFSRFLKNWVEVTTNRTFELRQTMTTKATLPLELRLDEAVLKGELDRSFAQSRQAEILAKKTSLRPEVKLLTTERNPHMHPIAYVRENKVVKGVFKPLSGRQMAGELASYLLSIFCGVDFFHCVVPSYCWVEEGRGKTRSFGIFSCFHEGYRTAYDLYCTHSKSLKPLEDLPDEYVQGICLMHMLRGSEDAHMKNTLVQTVIDPTTGVETVVRIQEIDGEDIMSLSGASSDRFGPKDVASMRIWWMGLPQAEKPLNEKMRNLISTWTCEKLFALHAIMGLFPKEKIDAQIWRLEQIKRLAQDSASTPISVRHIFDVLINNHHTLGLLKSRFTDPLQVYTRVGSISVGEVMASPAASTSISDSHRSFGFVAPKKIMF